MSNESGSKAKGGSGNGLKIALVVVLLGAAGYFAWANYGGGSNTPPPNAADRASEEVKQQNEEHQKQMESLPEEAVGGA